MGGAIGAIYNWQNGWFHISTEALFFSSSTNNKHIWTKYVETVSWAEMTRKGQIYMYANS